MGLTLIRLKHPTGERYTSGKGQDPIFQEWVVQQVVEVVSDFVVPAYAMISPWSPNQGVADWTLALGERHKGYQSYPSRREHCVYGYATVPNVEVRVHYGGNPEFPFLRNWAPYNPVHYWPVPASDLGLPSTPHSQGGPF